MDFFDYCLNQFSVNSTAIQSLVAGIGAEQARWKPESTEWSVLEVVNHLADEEREDFRAKIEYVLGGPSAALPPPIDPGKWPSIRAYNERDLGDSLANFVQERERSLAWLHGLPAVSWEMPVPNAPVLGFRAGDLLAAWAAHDILHLRQLVELKWAYGLTMYAPFDPTYAGEW